MRFSPRCVSLLAPFSEQGSPVPPVPCQFPHPGPIPLSCLSCLQTSPHPLSPLFHQRRQRWALAVPGGPRPPDGGWGWAVLGACFVITGSRLWLPKAVRPSSARYARLRRWLQRHSSVSSIMLAMPLWHRSAPLSDTSPLPQAQD